LLCPAYSFYDPDRFGPRARSLVDRVVDARGDDQPRLRDLTRLANESVPPLDRVVHRLGPWVSFAIVPLFALANAGIELSGDALSGAPTSAVVLGTTLGLLVGKPIGIFAAGWLAARSGLGRLPEHTSWRHLFGLGIVAGVGFTVAIFITGLSFDDQALTDEAKIGILIGSILAGLAGYLFLRSTARRAG
jgi:NhaA family Na+:H+ antiporter